MIGTEFAYWLQGHFELMGEDHPLTVQQVDSIREHLTLAKKNDPNDVFLSLMEGLMSGFSMITDSCAGWNEKCVREMRLWLTSRIESSVKAQFEKVTSELKPTSLTGQLNTFINPLATCSLVGGNSGGSTRFC